MTVSMRLYPNKTDGGGKCSLYIEGLSDPKSVIDKYCTVKIFELDIKSGKGEKPVTKDLLAEFETTIVKGTQPNSYYFDPGDTKRIDGFPCDLPKPEYRKDNAGKLLPEPLKYKPSYFYLALDHGGVRPAASDYHCIIIRGDKDEVELYVYEISFSVEIENKEIFNGFKMQTFVDCMNILTENCIHAAKFFKDNHDTQLVYRSAGTHYGNKFKYAFSNENAYLKYFYNNDQTLINQAKEKLWKDSDKIKFDKDRALLGLQETSCIGYVLDAMGLAFEKAGMAGDWKMLFKKAARKGQDFAKALVDSGWVAIFYSPDAKNPWDKLHDHTIFFKTARSTKKYGNAQNLPLVPIFDMVVNYAPTILFKDGSKVQNVTVPETDQIEKIKDIPFAFLLGRAGTHTGMLLKGKVYEVHWEGSPYTGGSSLFSLTRDFEFNGDQNKSWDWLSGLIVTPRCFWPKPGYKFQ